MAGRYKDWAEAMLIFAKYKPDDVYGVNPAHDEIHAGPDPKVVSKEDKTRLKELGWMPDQEDSWFKFT